MEPSRCVHANLRKSGRGWTCVDCGSDLGPLPPIPIPMTVLEGQWLGFPIRGLVVWATTLVIAIVVEVAFPFVHYIASMLGVLCHEAGHALAAILTGHPAIPSFDLRYGGGVTLVLDRTWWMVALVVAGTCYLAYHVRYSLAGVVVCAAALLVLIGLMVTGYDAACWVEMGHAGQLVASGIFLYRALSGSSVVHAGERWLYGFLGWSIGMDVVTLCWQLITDPEVLARYYAGKGGLDNDFVVLAQEHMNCSVAGVAEMNLVFCALVPILTVVVYLAWQRLSAPRRS